MCTSRYTCILECFEVSLVCYIVVLCLRVGGSEALEVHPCLLHVLPEALVA